MKQKFLIIAFFLLLKFNSYSQLTLEHTYYDDNDFTDTRPTFFNTQNKTYYYNYTAGDHPTVTIYDNATHEVYKTVQLPSEQYYYFDNVSLFCDKLFNSDDLIEFVYVARNTFSGTSSGNYKMKLMNENGDIVMDLESYKNAAIIKDSQDQYKFIVQCLIGTNATSIYSLPGTLLENQSNLLDNKMISYPNPTDAVINISIPQGMDKNSELKIFTIDGKEVLKTKIKDDGSKIISVDVSTLSSGTYIYKINGISNKFIKE